MLKLARPLLTAALFLTLFWTSAFAQDDAQPIAVGDTVSGELTAQTPRITYSFTATADQVVSISLTSNAFDPFLTLTDADGQALATDDDSGETVNSLISSFIIPEAGTYLIIAQSLDAANGARLSGDDFGAFQLALTTTNIEVIEYGQSVEGELTADQTSQTYNFRGDAGDTILITLIANDGWDTYLNLYRSGDQTFALVSNDDGAGNLNSLIGPFVLPEDGVYTIEATSFGGEATGSYTLDLLRAEVITLEYGDSQSGSISSNRGFAYYQFDGEAGDIIDLEVVGGAAIGTALTLNGPEGYQSSYSDSYSGADPAIRAFQLPSTGTYTVLIRALESGDAGEFTVTLDEAQIASLDDGPQTLTYSSTVTRNVVSFTGTAGEDITLRLTVEGDISNSLSATVTSANAQYTSVSGSGVSELTATFAITNDGLVIVQVDDYSYRDLEITVSVEADPG